VKIYIKEDSLIARIAAWKMKSNKIAIVIGKTIHLHNASRDEFIENKRWVTHELEHIRQYRKYGLVLFIIMYLVECAKRGYHNNKYEIAARAAERED
jgi:hypothetical protein